MSHNTKVKLEWTNTHRLLAACEACDFADGYAHEMRSVRLYGSNTAQGDLTIRLASFAYPVVVNTKTGEIVFDTYGGAEHERQERELNELSQQYRRLGAMEGLQDWLQQGYATIEEYDEEGNLTVLLELEVD
jgi:hypothetical protein